MKLLSVLLVSTAVLMTAATKIPEYIHLCKRNDPKIDDCIINSIYSMMGKLVVGIPELDVPSLDPLLLEKLDLDMGPGLTAKCKNIKLTGARKVKIDDLEVDLDGDTFKLSISFPEITVHGDYTLNGKLGSLPLRGSGPLTMVAKSITGRGILRGKKVKKGGKTLYYFSSMDLKLDIKDYDIRLDNLFDGDATIGEATNKVLNTEKAEILSSITPPIEKALAHELVSIGNNIVKHFTFEELFPEK